jgi:hypothetical protein
MPLNLGKYCHFPRSIYLLHRPHRRVEGGYGRNQHPCIFQVLVVALNYEIPQRMWYYSWFMISFVGRVNCNDFHLAFFIIIAFTPQGRESVVILPASMSNPSMHSQTEKVTPRQARKT